MRLLLDTHVLLWWLSGDARLSKRGVRMIREASVYVSAATVWEMSIKSALGKLRIPDNLTDQLDENQFQELPVLIRHATLAAQLPVHHGDPFDRMLVAQAFDESLTLFTHDATLAQYNARVMLVQNV